MKSKTKVELSEAAKKRNRRKNLTAYLFIAPNFIGFVVFTMIPILVAFAMAFCKWDGNNAPEFIGFSNFVNLFQDTFFLNSLLNTFIYSVGTVPVTMIVSLGLAVLLNQKIRGRGIFRAISCFPYVSSIIAVTTVWRMLFHPAKGPINNILYNAFHGISPELYEASELDGANTWQKFKYITWPQLRPTTFFVVIIMTIGCFKIYDTAVLLAGGSNMSTSAMVLVSFIYQEAFTKWNMGYASAAAIILFLIVLAVTLFQFKNESKYAND